jgi:hypothetical protein
MSCSRRKLFRYKNNPVQIQQPPAATREVLVLGAYLGRVAEPIKLLMLNNPLKQSCSLIYGQGSYEADKS